MQIRGCLLSHQNVPEKGQKNRAQSDLQNVIFKFYEIIYFDYLKF